MSGGCDLLCQFQFRPSELPDGLDVPYFFLERQFRLHDDHILRPADGHSIGHDLWGAFVGTVKVPHPAQASGRESSNVRVYAVQIFRRGYSRAFLRPAADHTANLAVQFHWRQVRRHQLVQRREHNTVVGRFSDIHGILSFLAQHTVFIKSGTLQ